MLSVLPLNMALYHKTTKRIIQVVLLLFFTLNLSVNKLSQVFVWGHFLCLYGALCSLCVFTEVKHLWSRWRDQHPFLLLTSPRVFWNSVQHIPKVSRAAFFSSAWPRLLVIFLSCLRPRCIFSSLRTFSHHGQSSGAEADKRHRTLMVVST